MFPKRLITIVLALLTLPFALGGVLAQQPSFQIGILAESTSQLGRGARLVMREVNNAGGITGADGTQFRLEPVFVPLNSTAPEDLTAATNQLLESNVAAVIGPTTTAEASAILPFIATLNVPIITTATDDGLLVNETTDLLFRARAANFFTERGLADYLVNDAAISNVDVVQFDIDSTVSVLSFTSAYQTLGGLTTPAVLVNTPDLIEATVQYIVNRNPAAVITYGDPSLAGNFYVQLRSAGYVGTFSHPTPSAAAFRGDFPPEIYAGILSATTWTTGATDEISSTFISDYARTFNEVPNAIAAASADAALLLSEAIGRPGSLGENLASLENIVGIQGILSPAALNLGETSNNVFVTQLNEFGAPSVVARFLGTERQEIEAPGGLVGQPLPTATPLPDGVIVTITSNVQNVRSGPGTAFEVIGQLQEGNQIEVIGANNDFSWFVIEFRGQQGWIANLSSLNEVVGELNTLPFITPPTLPTAVPQPTAIPNSQPDIVIQAAAVSPNPIQEDQDYTLSVTVGNTGGSDAGAFAISIVMPPDNVTLTSTINGLASGQSTTVNMTGRQESSGSFSATIVADANNQVAESPAGESNNNAFVFSYQITKEFDSSGSSRLLGGETLTLTDGVRINWDGRNFNAIDSQIGIVSDSYNAIEADDITSSNANQPTVRPNEGDKIVILTNSNRKAVIRVEDIDSDETSVELIYKVFEED